MALLLINWFSNQTCKNQINTDCCRGYTERYSTYYGQGVSFQYPIGWSVTKDPGTSLVFSVSQQII